MLEKLTLEEKIGQMFMFGINSSNTEGILELIKNNQKTNIKHVLT